MHVRIILLEYNFDILVFFFKKNSVCIQLVYPSNFRCAF